jgi:hypothetical protein
MSLIVKWNGAHWVDETGRQWDDNIKFNLPDKDVFVIDAQATTPALYAGAAGYFKTVGTTLFNMIVNPQNGRVYVTNTEARNHVRFEGAGEFAETTVRGAAVDSRITVLDSQGRRPPPPAQQAHRPRRLLRPDPQRRERPERVAADRHGHLARRRRPLRRRARQRQGRPLRHRRPRGRRPLPRRGRPDPRQRRRPDRPGPRRLAGPPVRDDPLRQRHLDHRHRLSRGDRPRHDAQPRAGLAGRRPPVPLRRRADVEPRRPVVRQLPHLRRQGRARVGPRRPRRRRHEPAQHLPLGVRRRPDGRSTR